MPTQDEPTLAQKLRTRLGDPGNKTFAIPPRRLSDLAGIDTTEAGRALRRRARPGATHVIATRDELEEILSAEDPDGLDGPDQPDTPA